MAQALAAALQITLLRLFNGFFCNLSDLSRLDNCLSLGFFDDFSRSLSNELGLLLDSWQAAALLGALENLKDIFQPKVYIRNGSNEGIVALHKAFLVVAVQSLLHKALESKEGLLFCLRLKNCNFKDLHLE